MTDGRRFEDNISVADLMKKTPKELMTMIYMEQLKTNGTVKQNCSDITNLQVEMKEKIGMKLFAWLSGSVAFLILIFNILDRVMA